MAPPDEYGDRTTGYRLGRLEEDIREIRKDMRAHDTWADTQHGSIWKRLDADRGAQVANRTALIIALVLLFLDIAVNWLPKLGVALAK
jgi:hypothetical protein